MNAPFFGLPRNMLKENIERTLPRVHMPFLMKARRRLSSNIAVSSADCANAHIL